MSFFTIKTSVEDELIEKKSRFIANVFYIVSEVDAMNKLDGIKKKHYNANHNVYAFRLENGFEKYSDDGEPSGTAGVPILDILRGENLANVLVVVTRYFGGILLGTGGLVRSYSGAAKNALNKVPKIEMRLCSELDITINYDYYNIFMHYCKNNKVTILSTDFQDNIRLKVIFDNLYTEKFLQDLSEFTGRTAIFGEIKKYYHE